MSKLEFQKLAGNRYRIVGSNNRIVSKEEKLKIEKNELVLEDLSSNDCQKKNLTKSKKIDKELTEIADDKSTTSNVIEETK